MVNEFAIVATALYNKQSCIVWNSGFVYRLHFLLLVIPKNLLPSNHTHSSGKEKGVKYKVSVSFLEVYNENIRDLLNDSEEFLDLREDPIKGERRYMTCIDVLVSIRSDIICFS